MSPLARLMIALIDRYRRAGGGERLLVTCNFEPSCSRYTREAIERYGALEGARLGCNRIRRCDNPNLLDPLDDPVPLPEEHFMKDERLEDELRRIAAALPADQRKAYYDALGRSIRDPDTYAVLSYALMLGVRHFYLGRIGRGLLDVFLLLFGLMLLIGGSPIGVLPLFVVFMLDLIALFSAQKIVKRHNLERSRALLEEISGMRIEI